jgi:PAS domain S-box-containing protein
LSLSEVLLGTIHARTRFWRGQAVALACVAVPTAIRFALTPLLPDRGQLIFYLPAILIAAVWGGVRASATTFVLSLLCAWITFSPLRLAVPLESRSMIVLFVVFLVCCGLLALVGSMLRASLVSARQAEARYKALVDSSSTVVFRFDRNGDFPEANPAWTAYSGLDWTEQHADGWFRLIHEDDREAAMLAWKTAVAEGRPIRLEFRRWHAPSASYRWVQSQSTPVLDDGGHIREWIGTITDIEEQRLAADLQRRLLHELQHRVKNTLAVVWAICEQSARHSNSLPAFLAVFKGRLGALSDAHSLLTTKNWTRTSLEEVARTALEPFMDEEGDNIRIEGPAIEVAPITTTNLALAFHELATNAAKHGALSRPEGHVELSWSMDDGLIDLRWVESGGPAVKSPTRTGFGRRLLERAVAHEPEAFSELGFARDGFRYHTRWRAGGAGFPQPADRRPDLGPVTTTAA